MENNSENHDPGFCETRLNKNEHIQTDEMPTHAHQMLNVVSELLAEGEDGSRAVALLVDCLDDGILADMVLETMKHLPESCPVSGISMQTNDHSGRLDNHLSVDMVLETKEE